MWKCVLHGILSLVVLTLLIFESTLHVFLLCQDTNILITSCVSCNLKLMLCRYHERSCVILVLCMSTEQTSLICDWCWPISCNSSAQCSVHTHSAICHPGSASTDVTPNAPKGDAGSLSLWESDLFTFSLSIFYNIEHVTFWHLYINLVTIDLE